MSTMGAIILANTPQLALSYLYVCYNALFTCMFVQREFVQYSRARKPLRSLFMVSITVFESHDDERGIHRA
ncbi:hypothetical protein SLS58_009879 [Diplodia intermedia]|uniref:Uncharacterized protein n=1 Tax=Diplodia intermedia TaxID=856260 RepID=A0ABR3T9H0_9PEZI